MKEIKSTWKLDFSEFNGLETNQCKWSQSINEIKIHINLHRLVKPKDLKVVMESKKNKSQFTKRCFN